MKLISWNVNGIRACLNKDFLSVLENSDADIFSIQESKCQDHQVEINTPDYFQFYNSAERKGYSGTICFTKKEPLKVTNGLGIDEFDHEGRVITLEYQNFFLVNVYTPNAQAELKRIDFREAWDKAFLDYLLKLEKTKPVIVCGDMNVAFQPIDLKNPKSNEGHAGYSIQEREGFKRYLDAGFIDTFRLLHPDEKDRYSWWSYRFKARDKNIGWRIDYFLVSKELKDKVIKADILDGIMGSDHCPILLEVDIDE